MDGIEHLDDEGLARLVARFYGAVRADALIGPVFDDAIDELLFALEREVGAGERQRLARSLEQVDRAVDAYIDNVAATPALYRSFVRELPGLGQVGADRGLATLERFADMLVGFVESGRRAQPELTLRPLPMDTAIIIVGGLRELLVTFKARYGTALPPVYITENGCSYEGIDDQERITYLDGHIARSWSQMSAFG